MTALAEPPVGSEEKSPILGFLAKAGFPLQLQEDVERATAARPKVRALTTYDGLLQALMRTRRPQLLRLAERLKIVVEVRILRYPKWAQERIRALLVQAPPCPAEVLREILHSEEPKVEDLARVLAQSPEHVMSAVLLNQPLR